MRHRGHGVLQHARVAQHLLARQVAGTVLVVHVEQNCNDSTAVSACKITRVIYRSGVCEYISGARQACPSTESPCRTGIPAKRTVAKLSARNRA